MGLVQLQQLYWLICHLFSENLHDLALNLKCYLENQLI